MTRRRWRRWRSRITSAICPGHEFASKTAPRWRYRKTAIPYFRAVYQQPDGAAPLPAGYSERAGAGKISAESGAATAGSEQQRSYCHPPDESENPVFAPRLNRAGWASWRIRPSHVVMVEAVHYMGD
ncbi:hypothetical protein KCP69_18530 [Salmonella enterica subsp. enterica]|nr:hypothetical protein KCP69_18530 [Salmonella enterica subsp. enterica]